MTGLFEFDRDYIQKYELVAGVDEAGRGSWAGPIVAAAVILQEEIPGLKDSKNMSELKRYKMLGVIKEKAVAWAIAIMSPEAINMYGIQYCNKKVMVTAAEKLNIKPNFVLFDYVAGDLYCPFPYEKIVKGDKKSNAIAAASIIAKTTRDCIMATKLANKYPEYNFPQNKGYGTKEHREAIIKYGISNVHRYKFCRKVIERYTQLTMLI